MSKKILFCSPRGTVGGISQWTDNVLSYGNSYDKELIELSWCYTSLPATDNKQSFSIFSRIIRGIKYYVPFLKMVKQRIAHEQFDVAHFCTSGGISFIRDYFALRECKKKGITTILHFHFGRMPQVLQSNSIERILFNLCRPYVDRFIAIDSFSYQALKSHNCHNVFFIPNPLSKRVESILNSIGSPVRENNLIIYAGHVIPTKGVFELVEACKGIKGVKLELLGQVNEDVKHELLKIAGDNSEQWLNIRGICSIEAVIKRMKQCSAFVLPSYTEGFPNVIIESMACGTPIIATSVGAIPEMLGQGACKCGILIEPKEINQLKSAIIEILSNVDLSIEMGNRAAEKVNREYSMVEVWNKLKQVWA